ncbi:hypothetical protein M5K25_026745 [Dendrobium thyrsiflorum]|uniref:Major facilitator superfamily (MFS) profile domain-containing protein n=1 Tax=Dendrobium thyrsiflorum TaxID=117978 RepID=A0ABD0TY39_DENTH
MLLVTPPPPPPPPPRPAAAFSSASLLSGPRRLEQSIIHTTSIFSNPLRPRIHPFPSLLSLSPSVSSGQPCALPADEQSEMAKLAQMGSGSNTFTVDDALISQGFGYFQVLVLAYAGMGWISEATEMMLLSFVGPSVQVQWNLSSHEESLITSVVFVGMLIGAYSWGIVSDNYGRRQALTLNEQLVALSLKEEFISAGVAPVSMVFSVELHLKLSFRAPGKDLLSKITMSMAVMPKLGWRWLLAFSSVPSFLLLLFYRIVPESPRYLCMKGRTSEAMHILEKMARTNRVTLPPGVLVSDIRTELDENPHPSESTHLINVQDKKTAVVDEGEPKTGGISAFAKLLSPELIRSTLLLWITFFGNAFSYYGIVLLTSELSGGSSKCASETIIRHSVGSSLYKNVFISSFAEVPGLLLSATIVDRLGRKLSMSAMLFISCAFLLPLVVQQNEAITTALLFGARICISGSFNVVYVYAPEIYPTSLRTTGVGTASSVGRIGGMLCPLVAVALVHGCHQTIALLLFELVLFLSGMAVIYFPVETSGKGLADSVSSMK